MDDLSALKFVSNSTPIRSIQGVAREEGRNRRKHEEEQKQQRKEQEDTLELNQPTSQAAGSMDIIKLNTNQTATGSEGIPGEHIDVRI